MSLQYQPAELPVSQNMAATRYRARLDAAVDKGLAQNAKEATMPFSNLCAKLQRESMVYAHRKRRAWLGTPYDKIVLPLGRWDKERYAGHTQCARERYKISLASYWVEQLTPEMAASEK